MLSRSASMSPQAQLTERFDPAAPLQPTRMTARAPAARAMVRFMVLLLREGPRPGEEAGVLRLEISVEASAAIATDGPDDRVPVTMPEPHAPGHRSDGAIRDTLRCANHARSL